VSEEFCQLVGVPAEQVRGQFWLKVVHPEDRTRVMNAWDESITGRKGLSISFKIGEGDAQRVVHLDAVPLVPSGAGRVAELATGVLRTVEAVPVPREVEELPPPVPAVHPEFDRLKKEHAALRSECEKLQQQHALVLETQQQAEKKAAEQLELQRTQAERAEQSWSVSIHAAAAQLLEIQNNAAHERSRLTETIQKLESEREARRATESATTSHDESERAKVTEQLNRQREQSKALEDERDQLRGAQELHRQDSATMREVVQDLRRSIATVTEEREALKSALTTTERELQQVRAAVGELNRVNGELTATVKQNLALHEQELLTLREQLLTRFEVERADFERQLGEARASSQPVEQPVRILDRSEELPIEAPQVLEPATPVSEMPQVSLHVGEESLDKVIRTVAGIFEFQARQGGSTWSSEIADVEVVVSHELATRFKALLHMIAEVVLAHSPVSDLHFEAGPALQTFRVRYRTSAPPFEIPSALRTQAEQLGLRLQATVAHGAFHLQLAPPNVPGLEIQDAVPPTTPNVVVEEVARPEAPAPHEEDEGEEVEEEASPPFKILIVEDNQLNQRLLKKLIEELGYGVELASHGREALARLQAEPIGLVLMDCQMPVMDGYQATKGIRSKERKGNTRAIIIGMSAHVDTDSEERCLGSGMDGFLTKPVQRPALLALMDRFAIPKAVREG
jgi:CheY-like chemotaxis protein